MTFHYDTGECVGNKRDRFNEFPAGRQEASSPLQKAVSQGLSGAICGIFFLPNDQDFYA